MNYKAITKEISDDFLPEEPRTDIAVISFTDAGITIRNAAAMCNRNRLNLDIFKEFYQMPAQENNENPGGTDRRVDETEERIKQTFKKKFHDLIGMLSSNKIQAFSQIQSVEALEKELKSNEEN